MRIDIDKCQDIELLRREAWRLERVIEANVDKAADQAQERISELEKEVRIMLGARVNQEQKD